MQMERLGTCQASSRLVALPRGHWWPGCVRPSRVSHVPAVLAFGDSPDRGSTTSTASPEPLQPASTSSSELSNGTDSLRTSEQREKSQLQHERQKQALPDAKAEERNMPSSPVIAAISILGVAFLLGGGYVFKDQIRGFLEFFIATVEEWGPWGYAAYAGVYVALEVLALPAIPLTMTAGVIFGTTQGTALVSVAGTLAATIAFLIARYAARDKVRSFAYKKIPNFKAIDRAIGRDGLKFVTLLRLSPLLPLAASNYLYGLTSVDLGSYVLGSWIGMLPGTYAYVHAGAIGRAVLEGGEGAGMTIDTWQVALGLGATLLALGFIGRVAKAAVEDEGVVSPAEAAAEEAEEAKKESDSK